MKGRAPIDKLRAELRAKFPPDWQERTMSKTVKARLIGRNNEVVDVVTIPDDGRGAVYLMERPPIQPLSFARELSAEAVTVRERIFHREPGTSREAPVFREKP